MILKFVDFRKAFDCIHRTSMWKILEINGIPHKFISIRIRELCAGWARSHRLVHGGNGSETGRYNFSLVFNIHLDFILRKIDALECGIEWTGGKKVLEI